MKNRVMLSIFTMILLVFVVNSGFAQFEDEEDQLSGKSQTLKQKTLSKLGKYDPAHKYEIYQTLDDLAKQLWRSKKRKILKSTNTTTFTHNPVLQLIDLDGDNYPEQFAYMPKSGGDTQDFGFLFDLNKDGKIDYLVYNQGTMITMPFNIVFTFYHLIDSDYDGKIDIWVNPDVDIDGDGTMDGGVSAWLYDTNKDGKIDSCEHIGKNMRRAIAVEEGSFKINCVMKKKINVDNAEILGFANKMLNDINAMLD